MSSTEPFTQVLNSLITDKRIGATAQRIALYLGSKTDDWQPREMNVCETLGIGQAAYRTALRQLVAADYMTRGKRTQGADGRWQTEAPSLNRARVVSSQVAPKMGYRASVTDTSVSGALTQHPTPNTHTASEPVAPKLENRSSVGPVSPRASEPAPAGERSSLRVSKCKVCADLLSMPTGTAELQAMGKTLDDFHAFHLYGQ
jgi:hypothetical protein